MNIAHLKYALEVEKTRSISKAAENLFMGQPNLSRAIKELEESLGIIIFKRTSKGITLTAQGEEFLGYARDILMRVNRVESMYKSRENKQQLSISVPRASYVTKVFANFVNRLEQSKGIEIYYKETNAMRAINNILHADYTLGIIRYQQNVERYFDVTLHEKGLRGELLREFDYGVLLSEKHPLADKEDLCIADLTGYIQLAHGDPYVPSMPLADVKKSELYDSDDKCIFIFERGSQFDLLSAVNGAYMWCAPVPEELKKKYGLVQKKCTDTCRHYRDILICKKDYRLSSLEKQFITALKDYISE